MALVGTVRAAVDEPVQHLVRVPNGQVHNDRVETVGYGRDAVALRGAKPPDEAGAVLGDPVDAVQCRDELAHQGRVQRSPLPGDVDLGQNRHLRSSTTSQRRKIGM